MKAYDLVLFLHLGALLAAFSASGIIHFSMLRMRGARTGGEALQWLGACHAVSKVFPVALLTLVGSGAWMVHDLWSWSTGFVDAGLTGAAALFVLGGAVEAARAKKAAAALAAAPGAPVTGAAAALVRDPVWWAASWGSSGLAVGIAFAMVTKPGAAGAFAAIVVAFAAGAAVGLVARRRGPAPAPAAAHAAG
jgi:hypothetical protein